jgi:hypothetical protein
VPDEEVELEPDLADPVLRDRDALAMFDDLARPRRAATWSKR